MPFTFSHTVIFLPFKIFPKKWFSVVGLITGSMMPDFEYFLTMQTDAGIAHSIRGILLFNLPVGIILTYVFFYIVSKNLINNLPVCFKSRLLFITQIKWHTYFKENWFVVMYSIMLGAASHIFWDAFTHFDGFFALKFPVLLNEILIFSYVQPIYNILQHSSTLLGTLVILFYISRLAPENDIVQTGNNYYYWFNVIVIAFVIALLRLSFGGCEDIFTFIVAVIAAGLYAMVLTPLLFRKTENIKAA